MPKAESNAEVGMVLRRRRHRKRTEHSHDGSPGLTLGSELLRIAKAAYAESRE